MSSDMRIEKRAEFLTNCKPTFGNQVEAAIGQKMADMSFSQRLAAAALPNELGSNSAVKDFVDFSRELVAIWPNLEVVPVSVNEVVTQNRDKSYEKRDLRIFRLDFNVSADDDIALDDVITLDDDMIAAFDALRQTVSDIVSDTDIAPDLIDLAQTYIDVSQACLQGQFIDQVFDATRQALDSATVPGNKSTAQTHLDRSERAANGNSDEKSFAIFISPWPNEVGSKSGPKFYSQVAFICENDADILRERLGYSGIEFDVDDEEAEVEETETAEE